MTLERPLWMQKADPGDPDIEYSARLMRALPDAVFDEGRVASTHLVATERGAGANTSVDISAGLVVVEGNDESNQGKYLLRNTATYNLAMPAKPAAGQSRVDLVVARVRDAQAGGGDGASDADWVIESVQGSAVADPAVPAAPTVPDSSVALASVLRAGAETSIGNAAITRLGEGGIRSDAFGDEIIVGTGTISSGRVARIMGRGADSAGSETDYARVDFDAEDATDGSEDGRIRVFTLIAGANTEGLRVDPNGVRVFRALLDQSGNKILVWGSGSPETVVTAPVGCKYLDQTNGTEYIKRTGAAATGWRRADASRVLLTGFSHIIDTIGTNTQMGRALPVSAGTMTFAAVPVRVDRAGSVIGISVAATDARTAGSVTFEVYKNGSGTGLTVTLDGSNTTYNHATQAVGLDTFAAGDRIDVRATKSAYTPATNARFEASVTLEVNE